MHLNQFFVFSLRKCFGIRDFFSTQVFGKGEYNSSMDRPPFISWRSELLSVIILGVIAAASAYLFNVLPNTVVTHWNLSGEPNGYSSRMFVVLFFPILALSVYLLMLSVWRLDPKRGRYQEFKRSYHGIKTLLLFFIAGIYALVAWAGLGHEVYMSVSMPLMLSFLFLGVGFYLPHIKQNWMFGVRTPWTLGSELVWNKTHQLAGKTFMIGGFLFLVSSLFSGTVQIICFTFGILVAVVVPVVYSYFLFSRGRK